MKLSFSPAERVQFVRFALTFAGLVMAWACLNDSYLVRVEPRHFTEFHRPLLPIRSHAWLALQYAIVATLGPGLVFGFLAYFACRRGVGPKFGLGPAAAGFAVLLGLVEGLVLALGRHSEQSFLHGQGPIYPAGLYPELTPGIVFTQTVNISATFFAPILGTIYLGALWRWRRARGKR